MKTFLLILAFTGSNTKDDGFVTTLQSLTTTTSTDLDVGELGEHHISCCGMKGWKLSIQVGKTHQRSKEDLSLYSWSLEKKRRRDEARNYNHMKYAARYTWPHSNISKCVTMCLTLRDEQAVTLEAAMMKSKMSMVAPGRPILKNLGLQCLMIVFTISWK